MAHRRRRETDFAHRKPRCDVLLLGSAHAPRGRRVSRLEVELHVGSLRKRFAVVGYRTWRRQVVGFRPDSPAPFERLPIRPPSLPPFALRSCKRTRIWPYTTLAP